MGNVTTVQAIFDAGAASYDGQRRKVIPCFDDFYNTLIDLIPFYSEGLSSVLDLGTGTGLVSALILERFPRASLTLVDISEKMLSKARERFGKETGVRFAVMDYASSPLPGEHDLVVSAMSIHHLPDAGKRTLFQRIFNALRPGGGFIHAEIVKGATESSEALCRKMWLDHLRRTDLTGDQLSVIIERMSYDRTAPLEDQLNWLRDAGFDDVDCFYRYYNFAVYAGKRARGPQDAC